MCMIQWAKINDIIRPSRRQDGPCSQYTSAYFLVFGVNTKSLLFVVRFLNRPPAMVLRALLRRSVILRTSPSSAAPGGGSFHFSIFHELKSTLALSNTTENVSEQKNEKGSNRWFTLPPYTTTVNGSVLGNRILNRGAQAEAEASTVSNTALKWVIRCCPELPRSLVQKLFRLRKVPSSISLNALSFVSYWLFMW